MVACIKWALLLLLSACTGLSPQLRWQHAEQLAAQAGWEKLRIPTGEFVLTAYVPHVKPAETLTIYIEGDGLAFISRSEVSMDPTPMHPLALELALRQPQGVAVYLARPCQYVDPVDRGTCRKSYWTDRRFSNEAIVASNQAVDALKLRYRAGKLILVGYSGGGAVAALLAARRADVAELITVAGNLDPAVWTMLHHDTPLVHSLNPSDEWKKLQFVPQKHLIGERDEVISAEVSQAYAARFPDSRRPELIFIPGFTHVCCWVEKWQELWTSQLQ